MANVKFVDWIAANHPKFRSLTDTVVLIITSLLKDAGITYLTVTGRTKGEKSCLEKANRKRYRNPAEQMTDISGIRIVVYFDYDVDSVCKIIEQNFSVDKENSSNRDDALSVNEVGYRSVHYVCDLGEDRTKLQEHRALSGLKFEFQVRTVLQHAWAELAHDRDYKFSGQLPKSIERKLFLLAGLMETADNGFSDLSREIDDYINKVSKSTARGKLTIDINSLSLEEFMVQWAKKAGIEIEEVRNRDGYNDLIRELRDFGITTLGELNSIIPDNFVKRFGEASSTIFGIVRDWMVISNPDKFLKNVDVDWNFSSSDLQRYENFISKREIAELAEKIGVEDEDHINFTEVEESSH